MASVVTATRAGSREVTTIDVLKLVAVVLMLADHIGLYVYDSTWLRIAGRPVAVIFGFLIGFSSSKQVPPSWVGLGVGLSLLNRWLFPESDEHPLDILLSLALTRIAMPFFESAHARQPLLLVPIVALLGVLTEPVNAFLEYGTEVPILALLGLAVRRDRGRPVETTARHATALAALIAIGLVAIRHFHLEGGQAVACMALLALTILTLASFVVRPVMIPPVIAPFMRWTGRNTLWIYAIHLAALQIAAWWLMDATVSAAEED